MYSTLAQKMSSKMGWHYLTAICHAPKPMVMQTSEKSGNIVQILPNFLQNLMQDFGKGQHHPAQ